MSEFLISKLEAGNRLDHFLASKLSHLSRARIQNLIQNEFVTLNQKPAKPGARLKENDFIKLTEPPPAPVSTQPQDIPIDLLFEDDDLLVINKAAGMVVHPAAGNADQTLVNALLHYCETLSGIGGELRPGIVHRLDKETSGCIVIAKNDFAHQQLSKQFSGREVFKLYLALVRGIPKFKTGVINTPIGRHPIHRKKMAVVPEGKGRIAKTEYRVIRAFPDFSLVECKLHTGRTHQIRVHLKHLGHPLLGDKLYGTAGTYPRQMLHAWRLGFAHPRTGKQMEFRSPLPPDFVEIGITDELL